MKLTTQHLLLTSAFQQEIKDLQQEIKDLKQEIKDLKEQFAVSEQTVATQSDVISSLTDHVEKLQVYMKKGLHLSNKVKMRVTLTLARVAVEKAVGRVKEDFEMWSSYIYNLSPAEWSVVGISKKLVKELLADGAFQFNDSIHNIPAEEVVGAIAGMRQGSLRGAWEEIFFMAFQRQVSDEVFAEEVDYALHQQEMLGL